MMKFYFTYALEGHPFSGGWTEVIARNFGEAIGKFREKHPDKIKGRLNCAYVSDAETFESSRAYTFGNFGKGCQEVIE